MAIRKAEAEWKGGLHDGTGSISVGSGAFSGPYSLKSRVEDTPATNPEELIGAAHAGCYSMQLGAFLEGAGHTATRIHTKALVHFGPVGDGFAITAIDLTTEAEVPGLDEAGFLEFAEKAKAQCPVSKALAATPITLKATLL